MDQFDAKVIFPCQSAQALPRPLPNLGRVGAEEARTIDNLAIHYRVALAEMVADSPVTSRFSQGRSVAETM